MLALVTLLVISGAQTAPPSSTGKHSDPRARREVPDNAYVEEIRGGADYEPYYDTTTAVVIIKQIEESSYDGTFKYSFETGNGISVAASGYQKPISPKVEALVMKGQYSYPAPDGRTISVSWRADENGFHAEGPHLQGFIIWNKANG